MRSRVLVAALGVPVILVLILWAPVRALAVALGLLSAIAAYELMACVDGSPASGESRGLARAAVVGALCAVLFQRYFGVLAVAYTVLVFAYAVYRAGEVKFQQIMAAIASMVLIPYGFAAFLRLDEAGFHRAFLLLPLLFSFGSDTGAFFAGRAFGRHKLAPRVSPHKTVEGAVGGLLGNGAAGLLFAFVMNWWFGQEIQYLGIFVMGVLCSVIAQLGDLSFSLIKREFGVKDYGHIFLAHGGVLDRFDSVLFVAPVLSVLAGLL